MKAIATLTTAALWILAAPAPATAFDANARLNLAACKGQADQVDACVSEQISACMFYDDGNQTSPEDVYVGCMTTAYAQADVVLNAYYQYAIEETKLLEESILYNSDNPDLAGQEDMLRESQRAWVTLRDADCKLWVQFSGVDDPKGASIAGCKAQHTMRRIEFLQQQIGDVIGVW